MTDTNRTTPALESATDAFACLAESPDPGHVYICDLRAAHSGQHEAHGLQWTDRPLLATWETSDATPELVGDPIGREQEEDYAKRQQLGLRPIAIAEYENEHFRHPDQRPCPPWCAWAQHDMPHDISLDFPGSAHHRTDPIATAADLLRPTMRESGEVDLATWETTMSQVGSASVQLHIAQRAWKSDGTMVYKPQHMRLTVEDAQDLVTALQYLIAQADAAEMLQ